MIPTLSAAALILASAAVARADTQPVMLEFQGPGAAFGCPGESELRARVSGLATGPAFVSDGPRRARVMVARTPDGATLTADVTLEVDGAPAGERHLATRGGDCPNLMAAVALSLVMAIDPVQGEALSARPQAPLRPAGEPEPSPDGPPSSAPADVDAASDPAPAAPEAHPIALSVVAASGALLGVTPGAGADFDLGVHAKRGRLAGGLALRAGWPVETWRDGGSARALPLVAVPSACFVVEPVDLCVVGLLGALWVEGRGYTETAAARIHTMNAGARATWGIRVAEALEVAASAEVFAPLVHNTLLVNGATVWETPAVGGAASLGLRWRFFDTSARSP